jgi:hypothetical protein
MKKEKQAINGMEFSELFFHGQHFLIKRKTYLKKKNIPYQLLYIHV